MNDQPALHVGQDIIQVTPRVREVDPERPAGRHRVNDLLGQIRELENRVKKAVVFSDTGVITPEDMDLGEEALEPILPLTEAREVWQSDYINRVLALNDGNRTQTARDLDVDPRTIFRHLEKEREGA